MPKLHLEFAQASARCEGQIVVVERLKQTKVNSRTKCQRRANRMAVELSTTEVCQQWRF